MATEERPKIPLQLIKSWNSELTRLHDALVSEKTTEEDKRWIRERIEALHKLLFNDPSVKLD